ncbi:MAG: helix-turn-helix domain-containing protein [Notoacmeibacter sp.]|nr:helix-turn-helix domain-containing protein [Notoacmeibacter sp.]
MREQSHRKGAYTIPEFADWSGISRSSVYRQIASGQLTAMKAGHRTLIRADEAQRWLDALPAMPGVEADAA